MVTQGYIRALCVSKVPTQDYVLLAEGFVSLWAARSAVVGQMLLPSPTTAVVLLQAPQHSPERQRSLSARRRRALQVQEALLRALYSLASCGLGRGPQEVRRGRKVWGRDGIRCCAWGAALVACGWLCCLRLWIERRGAHGRDEGVLKGGRDGRWLGSSGPACLIRLYSAFAIRPRHGVARKMHAVTLTYTMHDALMLAAGAVPPGCARGASGRRAGGYPALGERHAGG